MNQKTNKARELLAEMFLKSLEEGLHSWTQGWKNVSTVPENAINNKRYRGINQLILGFVSYQKGYSDPRWCTFKQADSKGWKIMKGEKGVPIEFWSLYDKLERKTVTIREYNKIIKEDDSREADFVWMTKVYTVFNGEQIDGIPELEMEIKNEFSLNELMEEFIENIKKNTGIEVKEGGNSACYVPSMDIIRMPRKDTFDDEYSYGSVLLHEFSHSTGHESRLNRNIKNSFGTPEYAKEELRAEIASCFLANELPLTINDSHMDNHKAYVQNWISIIEKDKNELFKAIKDAEIIADYLERIGELEKCKEKHMIKEEEFTENIAMTMGKTL